MPELSVVIPVYNEAALIGRVLEVVRAALARQKIDAEIIAVNDGSTDGTADVLGREPGVRLIDQPINGGKGAAVKAGVRAATGNYVLIQDADLEYNPDNYTALLAPLRAGTSRVVLGSRFLNEKFRFWGQGKSPYWTHYIGNSLIVWLTNALYRQSISDYEGCYKVFERGLIQSVPVTANGFEYDNELVCKLLRRGERVVEVPIDYRPRSYAEGKKINWRHGMVMLWTILKHRWGRD
ncbi:MAG: glycosyltransferase family 2 protein [Elusimicrobia bacterium]|jgi:dolichol-phosphate mannosyltransferase|nr:glycosyltransferase family 2 protein [Elusimicrobiota bacterium]